MKELNIIQTELNAPKGQYNKFGGYAYRSCEDILQAVKPLLKKTGCSLILSDNVEQVGERYYIHVCATLTNANGESVTACAYAREDDSKKGMDAAQLTGATSSYARKYALNGLFAIDDCKDADATNTHGKTAPTAFANPFGEPAPTASTGDARPAANNAPKGAVKAKKVLTPDGTPKDWQNAVKKLQAGAVTLDQIRAVYVLTDEMSAALCDAAIFSE